MQSVHIQHSASARARAHYENCARQHTTANARPNIFWHQFQTAVVFVILTEPLTFALAGINGLPLSFQHKSGRGSPLTIHSSLIVPPTLTNTFASGALNSGRTIRRSLIIKYARDEKKRNERTVCYG